MGNDPQGLISYCKEKGIQAEAYSPLGGSGSSELITGPLVTEIGARYNVTGVQVALRWIYQQGIPLTTKTESAEHLAEDIDIFSWTLSDEDMATLSAATTPTGKPSLMMTCGEDYFSNEMEQAIDLLKDPIDVIRADFENSAAPKYSPEFERKGKHGGKKHGKGGKGGKHHGKEGKHGKQGKEGKEGKQNYWDDHKLPDGWIDTSHS